MPFRRAGAHRVLLSLVLSALLVACLAPAGVLASPARQTDPVEANTAVEPEITAQAAVLIEFPSGRVLYQKAAHERIPPASLTKMLTAILALEYGSLDDKVTVAPEDLVGESAMGLVAGEQQTLRDLLYGMLLPSGNDAAMAVARHIGSQVAAADPGLSDPLQRFAAMMNVRVQQLGLTDSHFLNPHGLDTPGHYSSAYDLATIAWYALHIPLFNEIVKQVSYEAPGHPLMNTNEMLTRYSGADGIKTGWTDGCGLCLVTSATRDGHRLISVVLNAPKWYSDSAAVLDYGFGLLASGEAAAKSEVLAAAQRDTVSWLLVNASAAPPMLAPAAMAQGGGSAPAQPDTAQEAAPVPQAVRPATAVPDGGHNVATAVLVAPRDNFDVAPVLALFALVAVASALLLSRLWGLRPLSFVRSVPLPNAHRASPHDTSAPRTSAHAVASGEPRHAATRSARGSTSPLQTGPLQTGPLHTAPLPVLPGNDLPSTSVPPARTLGVTRRREPNLLLRAEDARTMRIERAIVLAAEGKQGSSMSEFLLALKSGAQIDVADLAAAYRLSAGAFLALSRAQVAAGQREDARRTLVHGVLVLPSDRMLRLALYQLPPD